MSKSQRANTNPRHRSRLAVALMTGGLVAGCSGNDPFTIDPDGYDGISETSFPLLTNACNIDTGTKTMGLSVRGGETLYVTFRAADSMVVAAAVTGGGAECAVASNYKIAITQDGMHTGVEKVFLDYINGMYALGTTAGSVVTPGITVALGANSSMVVRGSSGADKIFLGSTYSANVLQYNWVNVNGDTSPDVRMSGVTDIKVSTGVGADAISADGGSGTGSALDQTITFSAYGGPDADTLTGGKGSSTLDGGDGDDKFVQSATNTTGPDTIVGGKGVDTVDYSVRTAAVNVTVCSAGTCDDDACGCVTDSDACHDDAADAKTDCDTTANDDHTACVGRCTVGDNACVTACNNQLALDLQDCSDAQDDADALCDATESQCLAACATPLCSVCVQDDGGTGEHDTINDDVEIVLGSKGNDTISARYAVCSDQAQTPAVKCTLKGNEGDDTLTGSSHNDAIDGGAGNDMLQGGLGDDNLVGGAGIDTLSYADRAVTVMVSLDSTKLWVTGQNGQAGENDTIAADIENLTGGSDDDSLRGNGSANIIHGGLGDDTIEGAGGNDALYGDAGDDLLYGGAGNDMLVGGAGADTLVGGDGDDFIDSTDSPAAADTAIDCDGVNDSVNTAGTAAGTADALIKDGSDPNPTTTSTSRCEL
jgi:Ca2+-binding RTX toxin-like protein